MRFICLSRINKGIQNQASSALKRKSEQTNGTGTNYKLRVSQLKVKVFHLAFSFKITRIFIFTQSMQQARKFKVTKKTLLPLLVPLLKMTSMFKIWLVLMYLVNITPFQKRFFLSTL